MQKVAILYDVSQAVLSTFDLDEVLSQILMIAKDYFRVENCAVLLLDPADQKLKVRKDFGASGLESENPSRQGVSDSAATRKLPVYAPDVSRNSWNSNTSDESRPEHARPLTVS